MDIYQERYLAHQKRKADILKSTYGTDKFKKYSEKEQAIFEEILKSRVSQRAFTNEPINDKIINRILELAENRPSSCNRKGIEIKVVTERDDKSLLGGLLVGGVGWVHRASHIFLFLAWEEAYKSPAEKGVMHLIDAGVLAQTLYLICESMNIGSCYINPNVRDSNKEFFSKNFIPQGYIFGGAMAIGNYQLKHIK